MSSYDEYRKGDVVRALFAQTNSRERYEHLYMTSPSFKAGVDYLVQGMIPIYLLGLGMEAVDQDRQFRAMYEDTLARIPQIRIDGADPEAVFQALHDLSEEKEL